MMTTNVFKRWFPACVLQKDWDDALRMFYHSSAAYHAMTASGDKTVHPQVGVLRALARAEGRYLEVGCGSGAICNAGIAGQFIGVDVSPVALAAAHEQSGGKNRFAAASALALPFVKDSFDGVYSFEVLEHVWDPLAAAQEMLRVLRPGGFLLISAPAYFSLDLHLHKKKLPRVFDAVFCLIRHMLDRTRGIVFSNIAPKLTGEIYPDCDLISAIRPFAFARALAQRGADIFFCDTTYMCAHSPGSLTTLSFQRGTVRSLIRHFGDHFLLLAHKKDG